jgi:hypothetical protein
MYTIQLFPVVNKLDGTDTLFVLVATSYDGKKFRAPYADVALRRRKLGAHYLINWEIDALLNATEETIITQNGIPLQYPESEVIALGLKAI